MRPEEVDLYLAGCPSLDDPVNTLGQKGKSVGDVKLSFGTEADSASLQRKDGRREQHQRRPHGPNGLNQARECKDEQDVSE